MDHTFIAALTVQFGTPNFNTESSVWTIVRHWRPLLDVRLETSDLNCSSAAFSYAATFENAIDLALFIRMELEEQQVRVGRDGEEDVVWLDQTVICEQKIV
jgi:hypothetical protein